VTANAFLAVDLTDTERHDLASALDRASPGRPLPGRRQAPEAWHITLRFLGALDPSALDVVVHEADEAIDAPTGRVVSSGLGAFPRPGKASVLYAAIVDREGLLGHLAAQCEAASVDAGLEPEGRPFVPHVTLSRMRPTVDARALLASFGEFSVPIAVSEVVLMQSTVTRGNMRYRTVERFPLT